MKFLILVAFAAAISKVSCETMTENLRRSQGELSLSHEFVQTQFIRHREMIIPILFEIQKLSIDLYLDAIDTIKAIANNVRQEMAEFGDSPCAENVRGRWEREVLFFVSSKLNFCLRESTRILKLEYIDLNYFDKDGSRVSNHVQNQVCNIMSQHDIFSVNFDYYPRVNQRLRDLLLRAGPWVAIMDELLDLMDHHTEQAIQGVTMCIRIYSTQFNAVAENALLQVRQCPRE